MFQSKGRVLHIGDFNVRDAKSKAGVKKGNVPFPFLSLQRYLPFPFRCISTVYFLTPCKHVRQNGKLRSVSSLLNAKCESLNARHRMRTVCEKCRDNLDGREDQIVGKSSQMRQPQREKREDTYYFCHVPQNIVSRQLGVQ